MRFKIEENTITFTVFNMGYRTVALQKMLEWENLPSNVSSNHQLQTEQDKIIKFFQDSTLEEQLNVTDLI